MFTDEQGQPKIVPLTISLILGLFFIVMIFVAADFGCRAYNRYQKRQDVANEVSITKTKIQIAEQQAKVNHAQIAATKAEAIKKYQESIGIRRAQDEIQKTLTPLYVQHEAIQAQLHMADSPNHTVIWAPAGSNGVPFVTDPIQAGK